METAESPPRVRALRHALVKLVRFQLNHAPYIVLVALSVMLLGIAGLLVSGAVGGFLLIGRRRGGGRVTVVATRVEKALWWAVAFTLIGCINAAWRYLAVDLMALLGMTWAWLAFSLLLRTDRAVARGIAVLWFAVAAVVIAYAYRGATLWSGLAPLLIVGLLLPPVLATAVWLGRLELDRIVVQRRNLLLSSTCVVMLAIAFVEGFCYDKFSTRRILAQPGVTSLARFERPGVLRSTLGAVVHLTAEACTPNRFIVGGFFGGPGLITFDAESQTVEILEAEKGDVSDQVLLWCDQELAVAAMNGELLLLSLQEGAFEVLQRVVVGEELDLQRIQHAGGNRFRVTILERSRPSRYVEGRIENGRLQVEAPTDRTTIDARDPDSAWLEGGERVRAQSGKGDFEVGGHPKMHTFAACGNEGFVFSPSPSTGTLRILDSRKGKLLHEMNFERGIRYMACSPKHGVLFLSNFVTGSVHLIDPDRLHRIRDYRFTFRMRTITLSPDEDRVHFADAGGIWSIDVPTALGRAQRLTPQQQARVRLTPPGE